MRYIDGNRQPQELTQERDEARREICEILSALDGSDNGLSSPAMIAQERGWEYLYPNDELFNEDNDNDDA